MSPWPQRVDLVAARERRLGALLFKDPLALHFSPTRPLTEDWHEHPMIVPVAEMIEGAHRRGEAQIIVDPVPPASSGCLPCAIGIMFGHVSIRQVSPGGTGAPDAGGTGTPRPGSPAPTVSERLFRAAVEVLIRDGSDRLTVRRVAAEAGLAVATAYAYLGSKDQLLAEIARRSIPEGAASGDGRNTMARNDSRADPRTADPLYAAPGSPFSVADVRTRIAPDIRRRVREAMGPGVSPERAEALEALYSSAVLGAGVGYSLHTGAGSVEQVANRILRR